MTQKFVRYSPDVEQNEPDFERSLQAVLDDMKQHMRGSLQTQGIGLVVPNAHAKGYGLARGVYETFCRSAESNSRTAVCIPFVATEEVENSGAALSAR